MKKGGGGGLKYLKEGNGTELMVSVTNNYLYSFSRATASTCESVTISLRMWPMFIPAFPEKTRARLF